MTTFAILGYGNRGSTYAKLIQERGGKVTAVCEPNEQKLNNAITLHALTEKQAFQDETAFFNAGKLADVLVIATQDAQHVTHAVAGLYFGYDLLLEKPIACSAQDCEKIEKLASDLKRKVFVCHVLRYAPLFREIKAQLDGGAFGKIVSINLMENVAYWHQAHSYVRGNSRRSDLGTPMIIAKCCHDLDLISWFINEPCQAVSSFGSLRYFTKENAPEDSAEYCLDCKHRQTCVYSAQRHYIDELIKNGQPGWMINAVVPNATVQSLTEALKNSRWGKCVFKSDNNVVDNQVVNMRFASGATAHLTMTAFSKFCYRDIHVYCEKGEIFGNMRDNVLHCKLFDDALEQAQWDIDVAQLIKENQWSHGGGDYNMIGEILDFYQGKPTQTLTPISTSMQSHYIGFAAEQSRLSGQTVTLKGESV